MDRLNAFSLEDELFERSDLNGFDFAGKELVRCTFRTCKMQETAWEKAVLEDCRFEDCDLSSLKPKRLSLRGVTMKGCKLLGVDWRMVGSGPLVTFEGCSMRYQSFVSVNLRSTRFSGCTITDCTFVDVDLAKATFVDCDLAKTLFERCDLTGADLSESRAVHFDPTKNRTKGAKISAETAALMAIALGMKVTGYEADE